jgi:HAD superfamily hydrolase (TIGR01549 family)
MSPTNGIKAVFYDLDGTLRTNRPTPPEAMAGQVAGLGLVVNAADRLRAARWEHTYFAESDELRADRRAFPDNQEFWLNFGRRQLVALGATPELAEKLAPPLHQYMVEQYRPEDILMPDVHQVLKTLKKAGYILAVVSNRDTPFQVYLEEIGLWEHFDFCLAAGEANSWKPDRGIFMHALNMAKVKADETVYVGDNYFADVVGARNAGLKPVLIDVYGLFEQPGCPVIRSHTELLDLFEQEDAWRRLGMEAALPTQLPFAPDSYFRL